MDNPARDKFGNEACDCSDCLVRRGDAQPVTVKTPKARERGRRSKKGGPTVADRETYLDELDRLRDEVKRLREALAQAVGHVENLAAWIKGEVAPSSWEGDFNIEEAEAFAEKLRAALAAPESRPAAVPACGTCSGAGKVWTGGQGWPPYQVECWSCRGQGEAG